MKEKNKHTILCNIFRFLSKWDEVSHFVNVSIADDSSQRSRYLILLDWKFYHQLIIFIKIDGSNTRKYETSAHSNRRYEIFNFEFGISKKIRKNSNPNSNFKFSSQFPLPVIRMSPSIYFDISYVIHRGKKDTKSINKESAFVYFHVEKNSLKPAKNCRKIAYLP